MALWFRPGYHLTEAEIRYAMDNSTSSSDAARFLHISPSCFRKYAMMYYETSPDDPNKRITLYDWFKKAKKKVRRKRYSVSNRFPIQELFDGKHPTYSSKKIKQRLIEDGILEEKCQFCGFHEQRITDLTVGLVLVFKDGNRKNHRLENFELICWNCYYLYYGDVREKRYINSSDVESYGLSPRNTT